MKYASDFRRIARDALRGKWWFAALTALVASLLGASLTGGATSFNIDLPEDAEYWFPNLESLLIPFAAVLGLLALVAVVQLIIVFIVGGAAKMGYAHYNLNLVDKKEASFGDLFSQFYRLGEGFIMNLLIGLFTFLWSMLFVIPGIIKSYSYAMTPYILLENPELSPNVAITASRRLMDGNKGRLFCLQLSFIGWELLCALPAVIAPIALSGGFAGVFFAPLIFVTVIGSYIVLAYKEAAQAAFYREISGTEIQNPSNESDTEVQA